MSKFWQALLILVTLSTATVAQTCPGTTTACPSPTYNTVTVGGTLTANGGGTLAGTYDGAPTLTGNWDFSGGLAGALTGGASLDLPLAGGTMTGALHMGVNTIDGSAIGFTGGTMNGVTIGDVTPKPGFFVSLSVGGVAQTFPASGNMVGTTDTQTLTNKTLTDPIANSITFSIPTGTAKMQSPPFIDIFPSGDTSGATDYANITSALAAAETAGIPMVRLNSGTWYVNSTILINHDNLGIEGAGATTLNSLVNGPAIEVFTSGVQTQSWEILNLAIQTPPSGTSATGITLDGASNGALKNVYISVVGPSQIGFLTNATSNQTATNIIDNLEVSVESSATSATGVKLSGMVSSNTSNNTFQNLNVEAHLASQTLLWLAASDTNVFINTSLYGTTPIAATAIKFDYSVKANWPSDTYFHGIDNGFDITSGASAIVNVGTPTGATPNAIYGFGTTNGATVPNLPNLMVAEAVLQPQGAITPSTITTSAATPGVGNVGYTITSGATPSAVSLSNGVAKTIASISVPAGNWDIHGNVSFSAAGTTTSTQFADAISATNNTLPSGNVNEGQNYYASSVPAGEAPGLPTGTVHKQFATTTTVYLVGIASFAISTMQAYGIITAVQTP